MKSLFGHLTKTRWRVFYLFGISFLAWPTYQDSSTKLVWYEFLAIFLLGAGYGWLITIWIVEPILTFSDKHSARIRKSLGG